MKSGCWNRLYNLPPSNRWGYQDSDSVATTLMNEFLSQSLEWATTSGVKIAWLRLRGAEAYATA
jgi:hypothetical protein